MRILGMCGVLKKLFGFTQLGEILIGLTPDVQEGAIGLTCGLKVSRLGCRSRQTQ